MENICSQGHVLDFGREVCSRCGGRAIGQVAVAPKVVNEVLAGGAPVAKAKAKKAKVVKEKVVKAKKVVAKKVAKKKKK